MKRLSIYLPAALLLATGLYGQSPSELAKYQPLAVLNDTDPKGEACGDYFRTVKVKKTEHVVFRFEGQDKANVLPITTLSAAYVDKSTNTPKASFNDLPGLPPEKGRMTRLLISKDALEKAPCVKRTAAIIPVQDE